MVVVQGHNASGSIGKFMRNLHGQVCSVCIGTHNGIFWDSISPIIAHNVNQFVFRNSVLFITICGLE
jgi:hypothetical protein